ncbi:MAG: D-alanine--D-alanine ligase [Prevotellaceae bacterium]|jgi:D-alanine-D-alanine ligase|nr:D-alanine--D-alanine ligase [Prevotellaceae bacterium]
MKRTIAILFGGDSSEKIISERSSVTIEKYLPKEKYFTYRICVSGPEWTVEIAKDKRVPVNKDDFSFVLDNKKTVFDCAFIIIHGTPGENGILQAYFDLLGIPYTTCSAFVSALTFDKYACKCYLRSLAIDMADDFLLKATDDFDQNEIEKTIGYPAFVKPNAGGSSFGITKVRSSCDLKAAVERAREEDCDVIIESFIKGTELSHGIYTTNKRTLELPVTQIVSKNDFFDYEAKYEGKSDEITPAPIPEELSDRVKALTKKITNRLSCRGLVRIDYIYSNDKLYFLEINTVPGMSEASIIPQQILHAGFSVSQVLDWLVNDSITQ